MELHPKTIAALSGMFAVAILSCVARQTRSAGYDYTSEMTIPVPAIRALPVASAPQEDSTYAAPIYTPYRSFNPSVSVEPVGYANTVTSPLQDSDDAIRATDQIVDSLEPTSEEFANNASDNQQDYLAVNYPESISFTNGGFAQNSIPTQIMVGLQGSTTIELHSSVITNWVPAQGDNIVLALQSGETTNDSVATVTFQDIATDAQVSRVENSGATLDDVSGAPQSDAVQLEKLSIDAAQLQQRVQAQDLLDLAVEQNNSNLY